LYTCIVCGYDGLDYPQKDEWENPTQCICPRCGFQSGYHDDAMDEPLTIEEFRKVWIDRGAKWFSNNRSKPKNWDLKEQLKRIDIKI
jgi:hypothetical protein